jgi:hypothetical protein
MGCQLPIDVPKILELTPLQEAKRLLAIPKGYLPRFGSEVLMLAARI